MKIITKAQELDEKERMIRKLKFMGKIVAERVASTGVIDYEQIKSDAENILAADDVICGF